MIGTKEHGELIAFFDKTHKHLRLDKESKEYWRSGNVYQNGETNRLYEEFLAGYALGKSVALDAIA